MIGRRTFKLVAIVIVSIASFGETFSAAWAMPFMRELMILQSESYSCGAAALATLLTFFYDRTVSEQAILTVAAGLMQQRNKAIEPNGIDALALRDTLSHYGVESKGIQTDPATLVAYFKQGGLPVILQLVQEQAHYVVAIGLITANGTGDRLLVADPGWGYRSMTVEDLAIVHSGFVLVPLSAEIDTDRLRQNQQGILSKSLSELDVEKPDF